jgi:formyltetrahydrofolate hydrolase
MVVGFGKKRREQSFKSRVNEFWDWYVGVADRFYATIEDNKCEDLVNEVSDFMEKTLPNLCWVFGPGEADGHSFTVTGEGEVAKQLLAEYWQRRAPVIKNWTFHASRQPTTGEQLKDIAIQVGEQEQVDVESMLLKTSVDTEAEVIDIVAWHPALEQVPEEHQLQFCSCYWTKPWANSARKLGWAR